jgi:predicted nucleic acid-binding protein
MNGKRFFDTNVLIYAVITGDRRAAIAQALLQSGGVIGVQQLNEFVPVARRKLKKTWGGDLGKAQRYPNFVS